MAGAVAGRRQPAPPRGAREVGRLGHLVQSRVAAACLLARPTPASGTPVR
jgi:hypothetical protein